VLPVVGVSLTHMAPSCSKLVMVIHPLSVGENGDHLSSNLAAVVKVMSRYPSLQPGCLPPRLR